MINDTFKTRRRIAKTSFTAVIALVPALLGMVAFGTPEQAPMMQAVMPVLMILIPALIANVSHYMHLVHETDKSNKEIDF